MSATFCSSQEGFLSAMARYLQPVADIWPWQILDSVSTVVWQSNTRSTVLLHASNICHNTVMFKGFLLMLCNTHSLCYTAHSWPPTVALENQFSGTYIYMNTYNCYLNWAWSAFHDLWHMGLVAEKALGFASCFIMQQDPHTEYKLRKALLPHYDILCRCYSMWTPIVLSSSCTLCLLQT